SHFKDINPSLSVTRPRSLPAPTRDSVSSFRKAFLRSDHTAGRSWSPVGQTPLVPGSGQRFGANVISAISNKGRLQFRVFKQRFTAAVFIDFLARLVRQADGQKLILILDGHPVHRAKKVRDWVAAHGEQIELQFLPGYSPELNPTELLNQDVKTNALGRRYGERSQPGLQLDDLDVADEGREPAQVACVTGQDGVAAPAGAGGERRVDHVGKPDRRAELAGPLGQQLIEWL